MSLSLEDRRLRDAVIRNDADGAAVQQAIRDGANVNVSRNGSNGYSPLMFASHKGNAAIVGMLLDAGADTRRTDSAGKTALFYACRSGHLFTVQLLINHDIGLLEMTDNIGWTPLFFVIGRQHSDIVRFLLDQGADPHCVTHHGVTALMYACIFDNSEIVRLLLASGVGVEARDVTQQTALYWAVVNGRTEIMRELISQHNANMFAVDMNGRTPFDEACRSGQTADVLDYLLEMYGDKLTHDHDRLALHELLQVAEYSFAEDEGFHPPLNPSRIILPLGTLTLKHLRTLLHALDAELIRNRDDTGKLPIHIACQTNTPVEVLSLLVELDPTTLRFADLTGALPIHVLCGTAAAATDYASVRYLVEQGGVGTLAARNQQGASPLHVLCGSTNPPLRAVQYLMQSFPGSVTLRTDAGQYPFMVAATDSSSASLSVVYELVRENPALVATFPATPATAASKNNKNDYEDDSSTGSRALPSPARPKRKQLDAAAAMTAMTQQQSPSISEGDEMPRRTTKRHRTSNNTRLSCCIS